MYSWLLAALVVATAWSTPAHAQDTPPEAAPSRVEQVIASADGAFGDWVVNPLSAVLFFDLWFWDNTLSVDEAIGTLQGDDGDERVMSYDEDDGYVFRKLIELDSPTPVLDTPVDVTIGSLKAQARGVQQQQPDGSRVPVIVGHVPAQAVDLAELGLEPAEADAPDAERIVAVRDLAPFPVRIDRATAETVEMDVKLPPELVPLSAAMVVMAPDGTPAEITEVGDDRAVVALSTVTRTSDEPISNPKDIAIPIVVAWLVVGAIFFTLRMQFVNIRMFGHALVVTAGKYDDPDDEGEISHFQALSSALSATVGLGNIAGVAIAVAAGGPGAIFWMVIAGLLGMSSKFTECTLGQMYRTTRPDGSVSGGPMHYLDEGLREIGLGPLGKVMAVAFALMCIGGSLGGGNMFQANQSNAAVFGVLTEYGMVSPESGTTVSIVYGLGLAFVVGLVIIGGIKRIGMAAGVIVPLMCGVYVLAGLFILVTNGSAVPAAFSAIVSQAFTPEAGMGGFIGVLIQGFRRAAFSNEAGVGSASIAHSAATTKYPVREGIVALLEPFIDTVVICTMTGLVVVVTGAYQVEGLDGVLMTQRAFGSVISWFPVVLSGAVMLFAFSTMISWSYYGERCTVWLFGDRARTPYRVLFLFCVFFGSVIELGSVLGFSDLMVLGMAFPNIFGAVLLSGKVKAALDRYIRDLKSGAFDVAPGKS